MKEYKPEELYAGTPEGKIKVIAMLEKPRFFELYDSVYGNKPPRSRLQTSHITVSVDTRKVMEFNHELRLAEYRLAKLYFKELRLMSDEKLTERYNNAIDSQIKKQREFKENKQQAKVTREAGENKIRQEISGNCEATKLKTASAFKQAKPIETTARRRDDFADIISNAIDEFTEREGSLPKANQVFRYILNNEQEYLGAKVTSKKEDGETLLVYEDRALNIANTTRRARRILNKDR